MQCCCRLRNVNIPVVVADVVCERLQHKYGVGDKGLDTVSYVTADELGVALPLR